MMPMISISIVRRKNGNREDEQEGRDKWMRSVVFEGMAKRSGIAMMDCRCDMNCGSESVTMAMPP